MPKTISTIIDDKTAKVLTEVAANEDRTLNKQASRVLREWAREQGEPEPQA